MISRHGHDEKLTEFRQVLFCFCMRLIYAPTDSSFVLQRGAGKGGGLFASAVGCHTPENVFADGNDMFINLAKPDVSSTKVPTQQDRLTVDKCDQVRAHLAQVHAAGDEKVSKLFLTQKHALTSHCADALKAKARILNGLVEASLIRPCVARYLLENEQDLYEVN
jgi:hypothetical protein